MNTDRIPTATLGETLAVLAQVLVPTVAKGVIIRRPRVVALAARLDLDRRAVRRMQRLRDRYGAGPLMLRLPVRRQALVLDPADVRRVLDGTPEPFATSTLEKRAALAHFEPKAALISHGAPRADRRRFNEEVLGHDSPMHQLAGRFHAVVEEEAQELCATVRRRRGRLGWGAFSDAWFRVVRRVTFGDAARDDRGLRRTLDRLRADANWAFLKPKRTSLRATLLQRVRDYLQRAEPGSLAAIAAAVPKTPDTAPEHQVPQWLFAFDPAGMTAFRTLALLASHPTHEAKARAEIEASGGAGLHPMPYLRACVLESLRLWPTTPLVLRETTEETTWETGVMPAGTAVVIFAPFFHRDDRRLPYADRLAPEVWLRQGHDDQASPPADWPLIPFSAGPGICPGRHLVLLLTTSMVAALLRHGRIRLASGGRLRPGRLPATLDHAALRFRVEAASARREEAEGPARRIA